jgi:prevent-host-death family protein
LSFFLPLDLTNQFSRLVHMDIEEIGAFEAKTHLSRLLEKVKAGRVYYITRRGRRIAELRPLSETCTPPRFGCDKGKVIVGPDFDAPIPELEEYTQ